MTRAIELRMADEWRNRLKEMIDADGRSLRAISKSSGYGENYVQQMLKDEKDPSFPRLARVLSVLGTKATVYVTSGVLLETDKQLRSALLSYGVDGAQIPRVTKIIDTFVQVNVGRPEQTLPGDQSQPASPRHEEEPSR